MMATRSVVALLFFLSSTATMLWSKETLAADPLQGDAVQRLLEYQAAQTKVSARTEEKNQLPKGEDLEKILTKVKQLVELLEKLDAQVEKEVEQTTQAGKTFAATVEEPEKLLTEVDAYLATNPGAAEAQAATKLKTALQERRSKVESSRDAWQEVKNALTTFGLSDDVGALTLSSAESAKKSLETRQKELAQNAKDVDDQLEKAKKEEKEAKEAYDKAKKDASDASKPAKTLSERLHGARKFRCMMAYCWGGVDGTRMAIEPVLDLPVGLVWAVGKGALPGFVNSHTFSAEFNLGLRWWFAYDKVSLMVYISKPIVETSDKIRIEGSEFQHSKDAIHRPYPSVGLGVFGDTLILGFSYDVLRNGSSSGTQDPNYPPDETLSRAATFTLAISPFNLTKNALGAAK